MPCVLCPGEHTTATLLYRLFHAGEGAIEQVVFSEIMPALEAGTADFGVCIHEGRFTWQAHGLALVEDLGELWERATSAPLPLGGILARHSLGVSTIRTVTDVIRDSLAYAHTHPEDTVPTMRRHAQELTREVMFKHVDLYVNHWTTDLSDTGRAALEVLGRKAAEVGMLPPSTPPLVVL
jgi:1,4-dihydroxy-6-naphthoate synthase